MINYDVESWEIQINMQESKRNDISARFVLNKITGKNN